MPPACASAIASLLSVTVSMAAEMRGMPSEIVRVRRAEMSTSAGSTEDAAGTSSTSSNVNASLNCAIAMYTKWRGQGQRDFITFLFLCYNQSMETNLTGSGVKDLATEPNASPASKEAIWPVSNPLTASKIEWLKRQSMH